MPFWFGHYLLFVVVIRALFSPVYGEKELMYDPVKGILFIDKEDSGKNAGLPSAEAKTSADKSVQVKRATSTGGKKTDLHIGRKKDPPGLYFKSGLEYYKNGDFVNALKNFQHADSLKHAPEYSLFIGKTLRSMGKKNEMIKTMFAIIKHEPESGVADDALLELALFYKFDDDYEKATQLFTNIIERYPFGTVYATEEDLPDIAREQRRLMRAEMMNILTMLGFSGDNIQDAFRKFQKKRGLPITEAGDRETVRALREMHQKYIEREEALLKNQQSKERFSSWMYAVIVVGMFNIIFLVMLFIKTESHRKHILEIRKIVNDLDVKKL